MSTQVKGLRQALTALGKIDKEAQKEAKREMRSALKPAQADARSKVPLKPPLSGWSSTSRIGWSARARTGVQISISSKRDRAGRIRLAALVQRQAAGAIFDMAGRKSGGATASGRQLIAQLNARFGRPSRSLWPTVEQHRPQIERDLDTALRRVQDRINRELA